MVCPTTVMTPCKFRGSIANTPWPILLLSSWLRLIFEKTNAEMLCNGLPLGKDWNRELEAFWQLYRNVNPAHKIYQTPDRLAWTLPFMYHGDEGRGRLRRAVLICSYQPMLFSKGHSFKSRLLASVFPGERYAVLDGDETLEVLHDAIASDMRDLFENGMEALRHSLLWLIMQYISMTLFGCFLFAGFVSRWISAKNLHRILRCQGWLAVATLLCCIEVGVGKIVCQRNMTCVNMKGWMKLLVQIPKANVTGWRLVSPVEGYASIAHPRQDPQTQFGSH